MRRFRFHEVLNWFFVFTVEVDDFCEELFLFRQLVAWLAGSCEKLERSRWSPGIVELDRVRKPVGESEPVLAERGFRKEKQNANNFHFDSIYVRITRQKFVYIPG